MGALCSPPPGIDKLTWCPPTGFEGVAYLPVCHPPVTGVAATGAGTVAGPTGSKALGSVDSGGG